MKITKMHKITKYTVDLAIIIAIIGVILVPKFVNFWINTFNYSNTVKIYLTITLILSAIAAIVILLQLRKMLKTVLNKTIFSIENVTSLKIMAICSFIIGVIYGIKLIIQFGIGTLIITIMFFIATLLFLTIKDVFKQAVLIKEENDWTV